MNPMLSYYILDAAWYLTGYTGFLYWARWDGEVGLGEVLFGLIMAFGGPFIWLMGFVLNIGDIIIRMKTKE